MNLVVRKGIQELETVMLGMTEAHIHLEPVHHFAKGMYARELFVPAGTTVTSKIHKTEHFAIIAKGSATVVDENGKRMIKAPCIMVTKPGTKRAVYVHEDMVWITFHPTEKTDVDEIEKDIIALSFDDKDLLERIK